MAANGNRLGNHPVGRSTRVFSCERCAASHNPDNHRRRLDNQRNGYHIRRNGINKALRPSKEKCLPRMIKVTSE